MSTIVVYKSKYGATKQYAQWIGEALDCEAKDACVFKNSLSLQDILTIFNKQIIFKQ